MIQHDYWIRQEHEKHLLSTDYDAWERLVKRRGYTTVPGWCPNGVIYLTLQQYAKRMSAA